METTRVIGLRYPGGTHMTVEITETEYQIFQQLMNEENLEIHQAFRKMLQMTEDKTDPPLS